MRVVYLAPVMLAALLQACGPPAPSTEELARKYAQSPMAYATLKTMAEDDLGSDKCVVIGVDTIQRIPLQGPWRDYWKSPSDNWSGGKESNLQLDDVLVRLHLTKDRYRGYMEQLARAGGERLTYCHIAPQERYVEVLVYREGFVFSGRSADMRWSEPPTQPEVPPGWHVETIDVGDGWQLIDESH